MNPPERAVVFSFDEKTQCQTLDRTQPSLPLPPGRAGTMTHDCKRNGTTDLFTALDIATGEVITECRRRHTAADVLASFRQMDKSMPRHLDIHVVLDNLSAHTAPEVTDWPGQPKQARWHLHFTPTISSWLNLVERWFGELVEAITLWATHWNEDPAPFVWHKAADEIIHKIRLGRAAVNQIKSATDH